MSFLVQVYASSRTEEMAMLLDWTTEKKKAFLHFQFTAQHTHYQEHYPQARYDIICLGKERIGRFYVDRMESEIRVMDITLLPDYRNQGIGRSLMQTVLKEAKCPSTLVSLHVEPDNPAKRLYERLGFNVAGEVSFYELMHWYPPDQAKMAS
jgi:ribosomal protein S18 acetylase RimI-like enzyme